MVWSLSFFSRLESMAAPPARARADYDYLIKLLLIGDSGTSALSFLHVFFCFSGSSHMVLNRFIFYWTDLFSVMMMFLSFIHLMKSIIDVDAWSHVYFGWLQVWVKVASSYVSRMAHSPLASLPPLGLSSEILNPFISIFNLMESSSSCAFLM